MRAVDLIAAKRGGRTHSADEIAWLVEGYVAGRVPDYQVSAWLMAVCWRGLSASEVEALTDAMVASGVRIDLGALGPVVADKHSTGGVGDKVTLVLAPVVAACGLPFAKMSGRSLGHTGGTLDKLESIPGFQVDLSPKRFVRQVREVGIAVAGQSPELVPADRLLYALRDVTATVDQPGLIAASVMSKKIAAGATAVVLDVTVGEGAFFQEVEAARDAAEVMAGLGARAGLAVSWVLSRMDQPLGRAVGNALEVEEAVACLQGGGPPDLRELVLVLAGQLLLLSGLAPSREAAERRARAALDDGSALSRFRAWIVAQGGPADTSPLELPRAPLRVPVRSSTGGRVASVHARAIAEAGLELGAGRETKDARIDASVGVVLERKRGDVVHPGDVLAMVHAQDPVRADIAAATVARAFTLGAEGLAPQGPVIEVRGTTPDGHRRRAGS